MITLARCRFAAVAVSLVLLARGSAAQEIWPSTRLGETDADRRIAKKLDEAAQLEFIETPLHDVVDFLKDQHDMEIRLDTRALEDVGIGGETPVTCNLDAVSLRAALRLILRDLEVTYLIRNEVLLITTPEVAEGSFEVRVYHVRPLLKKLDSGDLAHTVRQALALEPSVRQGPYVQEARPVSETRVVAHGSALIVRDTFDRQREVGLLLAALKLALEEAEPPRKAKSGQRRSGSKPRSAKDLFGPSPADDRFRAGSDESHKE